MPASAMAGSPQAELDAAPELVKTMAVKPPRGAGEVRLVRIGEANDWIDLQPCGGTHVARTGEIGALRLGKIEKKGRMNRRDLPASGRLSECAVAPDFGLAHPRPHLLKTPHGQVAEWSKAHAWKVCRRETVSRVRIPVCPP